MVREGLDETAPYAGGLVLRLLRLKYSIPDTRDFNGGEVRHIYFVLL